jgi:hypothetical protein
VLFAVAAAARVIKQTITMYRAVQIANIYCASFCGMLVISGLFTHRYYAVQHRGLRCRCDFLTLALCLRDSPAKRSKNPLIFKARSVTDLSH